MKKTIILALFLVTVAAFFYFTYKYFYYQNDSLSSSGPADQLEIATPAGKKVDLGGGIEAEYIETVTSTSTLAKINLATLDREIVPPQNSVADIFSKTEARIKDLIAKLKTNPDNFDAWIDLGLYRKSIDDYSGTKDAWENASILRPNSALPLSNLGNLYGYYLKDAAKAEEYYLKSIKTEPNSGFWYFQAFSFYKDVLQDMTKAKGIIAEGVKNNPYDEDLKKILESL